MVAWMVYLIVRTSKPPLPAEIARITPQLLKRAPTEEFTTFDQLVFFTLIPRPDEDRMQTWQDIQKLVGGLHQLRDKPGAVPTLHIYLNGTLTQLEVEETDAWNRVHVKSHQMGAELEDEMVQVGNALLAQETNAVWIAPGFGFDPAALEIRRAEYATDSASFIAAYGQGRRTIEQIGKRLLQQGSISLWDGARPCLQGHVRGRGRFLSLNQLPVPSNQLTTHQVGLMPLSRISAGAGCHVDLDPDSIINGAQFADEHDRESLTQFLSTLSSKDGSIVAIGVPTTSKGMTLGETPVMMRVLLPSLAKSITDQERHVHRLIVYVGFDHGDALFEDSVVRTKMRAMARSILPENVAFVFLRLRPLHRVAMTWNMIFAVALRHQADYFYQVNDDLTIKTRGWLTRFIDALQEQDGVGVVGPSDSFNGFSCSLLTQAMVSRRHFELFSGRLYPLELRDWKSDRWLSFVYGSNRTRCWPDVEATNGAKGTRYVACPFLSWRVYLERDQRRVADATRMLPMRSCIQ